MTDSPVACPARPRRGSRHLAHRVFGLIGTTFRELGWKTLILRAVPISPNAWYKLYALLKTSHRQPGAPVSLRSATQAVCSAKVRAHLEYQAAGLSAAEAAAAVAAINAADTKVGEDDRGASTSEALNDSRGRTAILGGGRRSFIAVLYSAQSLGVAW